MLVRWENKGCWENTRIGCYTHTPPDRDIQTYLSLWWFDLEQLLYLKRKNYGEGLSRVDLSQLTVVALVMVRQSSTH